METYKISQIAKLLGLSSDTIRFYEKKGLVHPSVNPDNQYREYDLDNILELLDIIYYRHLDISLQDIQSICTSRSRENMYELLLKKKQETEEKIRYEQQLLKKLIVVSKQRCIFYDWSNNTQRYKDNDNRNIQSVLQ